MISWRDLLEMYESSDRADLTVLDTHHTISGTIVSLTVDKGHVVVQVRVEYHLSDDVEKDSFGQVLQVVLPELMHRPVEITSHTFWILDTGGLGTIEIVLHGCRQAQADQTPPIVQQLTRGWAHVLSDKPDDPARDPRP